MSAKVSILVKSITPIVGFTERADWGRYVTLKTLSSIVGAHSVGVAAEFIDLKGATVKGRIVNVSDRIAERKFPYVEPDLIVVDTRGETTVEEPKRMQQGGVLRIQQRTPAQPKPNKRAQP